MAEKLTKEEAEKLIIECVSRCFFEAFTGAFCEAVKELKQKVGVEETMNILNDLEKEAHNGRKINHD